MASSTSSDVHASVTLPAAATGLDGAQDGRWAHAISRERLRVGCIDRCVYQWHVWDACSVQGDAWNLSQRHSTCVSFTTKRR